MAWSQSRPLGTQSERITVRQDTVNIADNISLNPAYMEIYDDQGALVTKDLYEVDFPNGRFWFKHPHTWVNEMITVYYLPLPDFMTRKYAAYDKSLIVDEATDESQLYSEGLGKNQIQTKPFDGLYTSGSLSRGVTIGSNQDAVVNSNFNLQIEGQLSDKVGIRASITDNEIPLQSGGFTQRLDEFDKVFIELYAKKWSLRAGDIDLSNTDSYLMRFQKKISGVLARGHVDHPVGQTDFFASGALVRGKFQSFRFNGVDGNQGPYKILGTDRQQYIIMISGSERVYANGVLLRRGENFDYTIDYNTGEITFTALYTVSSNLRFTVEYQLSERNYTRFLTYDGAGFSSDKLHVNLSYYNESDMKNSPVDQDLSDEQKQLLSEAGNDRSKMIAPSAVPAPYSENRILYRKTLVSGNEIFEYSTDPLEELYQVNFSYVGENQGDYVLERTLAAGRIYNYSAPVNGVRQGNYLPVVQLVAPEKLQVINARAGYSPSDRTTIASEVALSDKDRNLFSSIDNENNKGLAAKVNWKQGILNGDWKLLSDVEYQYISENFSTVERIRNVEFSRDWNILSNQTDQGQRQQYAKGGLELKKDSIGSVAYYYENLSLGENYMGDRHNLIGDVAFGGTRIFLNASSLDNENGVEDNSFDRIYSGVIQEISKFWVGAKYNYEKNLRSVPDLGQIDPLSHKFNEIEGFTGIGDSTRVFAEIGYNFRATDSVRANSLQTVNRTSTYFLKSKLVQNINTDLALFVNYRKVNNVDRKDESSLNARLAYRQRIFGDFISLQTLYETKSGSLPQQEFSYVEVDPGKGYYEWIDFNGNGIQELDEFVVAQFQDKAQYVRVLLPSISYLKTNQNKWSQSLNLNASKWRNEEGVKKVMSHFANQTYFLIDVQKKRDDGGFNLDPFASDDEDLLAMDMNFKNSLFFNRGLQRFSLVYSYLEYRKKTLFSFGDQDIGSHSHQFQFIHKLGKFWLLDMTTGMSQDGSSSISYANRNYDLNKLNVESKISYLHNKNTRLEIFYSFKRKENRMANYENLQMHVFGSKFHYANKQSLSLNANANLYLNEFEGQTNSPVAYQMLEGLQPGTNLTWLLGLQKRLTSFLDLNINYFGRKSENSNTIHTGNIQLRATF
jgi:hypothetical protein